MSGHVSDDFQKIQHARFAKMYTNVSAEADARGGAEHRRLLAALSGSVIEIGAGHGLNFQHYPSDVTHVLAIEPDDTLRQLAEQAAADSPITVQVVAGHADEIPAPDASRNNAGRIPGAVHRPGPRPRPPRNPPVLVPGGQLRYYEHVRSDGVKGALEDAIRPLWTRIAGGCHPSRRTSDAIRAAGLAIEHEDRFSCRPARPSPSSGHVVGRACAPYQSR